MCVSHFDGYRQCGNGPLTVSIRRLYFWDHLMVECPNEIPPPQIDVTQSIPLNVGTIGNGCFDYIVQIGCEPGNYCQGTFSSGDVALSYPILSPMARLCVKALGASRGSTWTLARQLDPAGDYVEPVDYLQRRGDWLEITIPGDSIAISLQPICVFPDVE